MLAVLTCQSGEELGSQNSLQGHQAYRHLGVKSWQTPHRGSFLNTVWNHKHILPVAVHLQWRTVMPTHFAPFGSITSHFYTLKHRGIDFLHDAWTPRGSILCEWPVSNLDQRCQTRRYYFYCDSKINFDTEKNKKNKYEWLIIFKEVTM